MSASPLSDDNLRIRGGGPKRQGGAKSASAAEAATKLMFALVGFGFMCGSLSHNLIADFRSTDLFHVDASAFSAAVSIVRGTGDVAGMAALDDNSIPGRQAYNTSTTTAANLTSQDYSAIRAKTAVHMTSRTQGRNISTVKRPRRRKRRRQQQQHPHTNRTLDYFLAHIPKAGGYYVYETLSKFLQESYKKHSVPSSQQQTFCNNGVEHHLKNFKQQRQGKNCTIQTSEGWPWVAPHVNMPYDAIAHKYVIVRDPLSHVLSMYFHCKESKDHSEKAHHMPSLDEWLQTWADKQTGKVKIRIRHLRQKFKCYNPTDFQTRYLDFDPDNGRGKEFMKSNFDVLGDFGRLEQSVCAIYIKYSGEVPPECNCTDGVTQNTTQSRRRLSANDHGVKHHGSTHPVTNEQRSIILDVLRPRDVELYQVVQEVFQEQVKEIEEEHSFLMCEALRELE